MKKILFLRREGVYLPEINAYMSYIRENMPNLQAYDFLENTKEFSEADFDIVWKFMGLDRGRPTDNVIVHEYGSLSVGKFPKAKNFLKRAVNIKPSLRVFLNDAVRQEMGFQDSTEYRLRDMGVSSHFFRDSPNPNPEFDFVYSGSLNRGKVIWDMLHHFKTQMKTSTLLVIGTVPNEIHDMFGTVPNIHFAGRLKYESVPDAITRAKYGLNIMPDIYPFNIQTSTKVLEYCAARMPVISTNYAWIKTFENESHGSFFYLHNSFDNLNRENLEKFSFAIPSMQNYEWNNIISQSQLFDFLDYI